MKTTYAHQKAITINRNLPQKGSNKKFISAYYDNITQAARLLSGEAAFKLYLYLLANQDKYVDNFSPANFSKEFGVSADRCRKVFSQLEEVGYLVCSGKDEYQFYEEPQNKIGIALPVDIEQRWIPQKDESFKLMTFNEVYQELKEVAHPDEIRVFWENAKRKEG